MNRRRFLHAALVAAAPLFLADAFAAPPAVGDVAALADAFTRAVGRPLLVIVIPADRGDRLARGEEWGRLLNEADEDLMALFAQAEVVCAYDGAVRAFAPQARGAEPWLWVIETGRVGGRAIPGVPDWPEGTPPGPDPTDLDVASLRAWEAETHRHEQLLARPLGEAVRRALTPLLPTTTSGERAELARRAIASLRTGAPRNSRWMKVAGCGWIQPDEVPDAIMCGMGGAMRIRYGRFLAFADDDEVSLSEFR